MPFILMLTGAAILTAIVAAGYVVYQAGYAAGRRTREEAGPGKVGH